MDAQSNPISLQFTEEMKGFVTFGQTNYEDGYNQGKRDGVALMFHLTIQTDDVDRFLASPAHEAKTIGYLQCEQVGESAP
jgi:cholesterol oxidase